ncbi:hypothetical protein D9M68_668980 [compost metagenome]
MTGIKSLADELRETIKKDGHTVQENKGERSTEKKGIVAKPKKAVDASLETLFKSILAFELAGQEKLLIRLDDRTVFLLKQLKVAKAIDMNKLIAYSLQDFLRRHPELIQYIKDNIKTIEL